MIDPAVTKAWRKAQRWTQPRMADALGMSVNGYCRYEKGLTKRMLPSYEKRLKELLSGSSSATRQAPQEETKGSDAERLAQLLASDLRTLAEFMGETAVPLPLRARRFAAFVRAYSDGVASLTVETAIDGHQESTN